VIVETLASYRIYYSGATEPKMRNPEKVNLSGFLT